MDGWYAILGEAGLATRTFDEFTTYPDEQLTALIGAAAARMDVPPGDLLERFGLFLADSFLRRYDYLIPSGFSALDYIEQAEDRIHRVLRERDPSLQPPYLRAWRPTRDTVRMSYRSPRRLCRLLRGLAIGGASHFGGNLEIEESECMLRGGTSCELLFRNAC